jgi:hypothetical protein
MAVLGWVIFGIFIGLVSAPLFYPSIDQAIRWLKGRKKR